jgi:hypothetical protein
MRLIPLVVSVFLLAGCGAAMSEEPAAETNTARIIVSWSGDGREGVFDLRNGTGIVDGAILTVDAVYEPIEDQLIAERGRGKRWLKSPREEWDPLLMEPIAGGPVELLTFLRSAEKGEPTTEGEERGEPVTYYAATVRMDEFIAAQPPGRRADLEEVRADWEGMVFQLAIDSQDRIRRAEFVFAGDEELLIEIFDYGVEVDARAPDPSTVMDWEDYYELLREECERLKKQGREKEKPHCYSCGVAEDEAA